MVLLKLPIHKKNDNLVLCNLEFAYIIRTPLNLLFTLSNTVFIHSSCFSIPFVSAKVFWLEWHKWLSRRKMECTRRIVWDYSIKKNPGDMELEICRNQGSLRENYKHLFDDKNIFVFQAWLLGWIQLFLASCHSAQQ